MYFPYTIGTLSTLPQYPSGSSGGYVPSSLTSYFFYSNSMHFVKHNGIITIIIDNIHMTETERA